MLRNLVQILFFLLLLRPFMALCIGLRVRGRERLPAKDPFLLVANHASHMDTLTLLSLFPLRRLRKVRPAAAADYFERNALVAAVTRTLFNILPIQRLKKGRTADPIETMAAALAGGETLILFPEGTRGAGGELAPFKPGAALLAERLPEIPVVPCFLEGMGRILPKGEFIPVPFFCEIRIGAPFHPRGDRAAIAAAIETAVRELRDRPAGGASRV